MPKPQKRIAIVVMSDEHSGSVLSCAGHPWIKTPHMDAFAEHATRFSSAYTNSPVCIPARAAFTTSQYAQKSRNWDNGHPYTGEPEGWTHILRNQGVEVTSIGKLHFRNETDDTGFSRQILPMHVLNGIGDLLGAVKDPLPIRSKGKAMADEVGVGESTYTKYDRSIAQETVKFIKAHADQDNWVLFTSFVAPHFPLIALDEFVAQYSLEDIPLPKLSKPSDRNDHPWIAELRRCFGHDAHFTDELRKRALRSYAGLCSFMDWHFQKILDAIKDAGLDEDALVIYTSDHGDNMGTRGLWGKSNHYEESARVPMLMRAPGVQARSVVNTHVSLVDVGPTLLDWFDTRVPGDWPGSSLAKLSEAQDQPDRVVFSEYHGAGGATGAYMIRRGKWKLNYYVDMYPELFDLEADPDEFENLADKEEYKNMVAQLTLILHGICDPEAVDRLAKCDQRALLDAHGGREKVIARGGFGATPAPGVEAKFA